MLVQRHHRGFRCRYLEPQDHKYLQYLLFMPFYFAFFLDTCYCGILNQDHDKKYELDTIKFTNFERDFLNIIKHSCIGTFSKNIEILFEEKISFYAASMFVANYKNAETAVKTV